MRNPVETPAIALLKNPYPYRAMLSICSDLDETASAAVYFNTSRYLNTSNETPFGRGVGLEVGNSMYFYMPAGEFSYWNASELERGKIREMMRAGLIDCIHSYGDTAIDRRQVSETLEHLDREECQLRVWIDHATAPTNFGGDIMQGHGDVPGHDAYHADMTLEYGVRFLSMGRVTSMQGQDAPVTLRGIYQPGLRKASLKSLAKEAAKVVLGAAGNRKYRMHASNRLLASARLRDGNTTLQFLRSNPNPEGVSAGDTAAGLARALTPDFLSRVIRRQGRSVIYTHLGKEIDVARGFPECTREALDRLSGLYQSGEVLVTTTRRLLDYVHMHSSIEWQSHVREDHVEIALSSDSPLQCLTGLSFSVPKGRPHRITVNSIPVDTSVTSVPGTDGDILSVPWSRLN